MLKTSVVDGARGRRWRQEAAIEMRARGSGASPPPPGTAGAFVARRPIRERSNGRGVGAALTWEELPGHLQVPSGPESA